MKNGTPEAQLAPETEVSAKARRRRFKAEFKLKILQEADAHSAAGRTGEVGALLRRHGLYSSHLTAWRQARERGELAGLTPRKRGPKAHPVDSRDREIAEKDREIAKWKKRAARAEALVALQKKVSEILGVALPEQDDER
jgi:transposase